MLGLLLEAPWVRMAALGSLVLAVQTTLCADLRWRGAGADLVLLLVIAVAVAAGPVRGARAGFVVGLAFDLLILTPFGLSALTYSLVALLVGLIEPHVYKARHFVTPVVVGAASAAGATLYGLAASVFGVQDALTARIWRVLLVTTVVNALLAAPFVRICRWAMLSGDRARW
jgi:rod shape-determining protein MreD